MYRNRSFEVPFPFSPYPAQEAYSEKMKEALLQAQNALLESPTGTGKTMALLCTALQYQKKMNNKSKIFFAVRTHTQINNVCKELKASKLKPTICLLASREAYCRDKSDKKNEILETNPGFCKFCKNAEYKASDSRFEKL